MNMEKWDKWLGWFDYIGEWVLAIIMIFMFGVIFIGGVVSGMLLTYQAIVG